MKIWVPLVLMFCVNSYVVGQAPQAINTVDPDFKEMTIVHSQVFSSRDFATDIQAILQNDRFFKPIDKRYINQGIYNKYHWIKLPIFNNSRQTAFVYEFGQMNVDSLQLFIVKKGEVIQQFPTKGLHFEENNEPSYLSYKPGYIYRVEIPIGETVDLYIRADVNDDPFRLVNRLWSIDHYQVRENEIKTRSGYLLMFTGFVILVCILALTMYVFTRHRLYLYYLSFVFIIFLNLLCLRHLVNPLYVERYLFLGNNYSEMFQYLQLFCVLMYTNHFLSLDKHYPRLYRALRVTALATGVFFIVALFLRQYEWFYGFSYVASKVFMTLISLGLYFLAVRLAWKRHIMAYYYLIAYTPLLFFIGHYIFTAMKLTSSLNPLEWEYVIFIEILALTVAMAHRYYLMMKENDVYQRALIQEQEKGMEAMIAVQEAERSRIAKDLHDGVVQQIGAIKLTLSRLVGDLSGDKADELLKTKVMAEVAADEARNLAHQMMPKALMEVGLVPAMRDVVETYELANKSALDFQQHGLLERYPNEIEVALYRIFQELMNNISKHAQASAIDIQLFQNGGKLILVVEDDGVGLPENKKDGMGMTNIKSRLSAINGSFEIESGNPDGTVATIVIPV